jgi:glutaredoxin
MIVLYVLEGCPYCNNSLRLLKEYKIKHKSIVVQQNQKEYYKKQNKMNTFPQIFSIIDKDTIVKIGGNSDLEEALVISQNIHKSNVTVDAVYSLYKNMYKK